MTDKPTRSELEYSLKWCESKIEELKQELELTTALASGFSSALMEAEQQLAEAQGKGETARVLLDEIVCALHVLDRRSIEVYGKRYTMPLKLREPIEEADKLLNGEKE